MKDGWKMVKLGDVCISRLGKTLNSSTDVGKPYNYLCSVNVQWDKIDLSVLKMTLFADDEVEKYRIQKGDLLVCEGGEAGRSAIWENEEPILYQNALHRIRFRNGIMIPRYCLHYLRKIKNDGTIDKDFARGATIKHLVTKSLYSIPIPLPPLEEQHRIVSILDATFEKIDKLKANAEENLKNAKAFYDRLLIDKISYKEGWIKSTLQDECFKITDGTHQTPKYYESGYMFLSSGNVTSRKIDWDNVKFIDETQHTEMQKRVSPKINDILLAKNGTTGVGALVDRDIDFDIYVSLALLRSLGRVTPQYLLYFINSPIAKVQFNKRLKGAGVPNLHLTEIRQVEISYPKEHEEQNRIVNEIKAVDEKCRRLETIAQQTIRECDALKQSILRQAFSGEL